MKMSEEKVSVEAAVVDGLLKKLDKFALENGHIAKFAADCYPITMTVRDDPEVTNQLSMLGSAKEDDMFLLIFTMVAGEIVFKASKGMRMSDETFRKYRKLFQDLEHAYLQFMFLEAMRANGEA